MCVSAMYPCTYCIVPAVDGAAIHFTMHFVPYNRYHQFSLVFLTLLLFCITNLIANIAHKQPYQITNKNRRLFNSYTYTYVRFSLVIKAPINITAPLFCNDA